MTEFDAVPAEEGTPPVRVDASRRRAALRRRQRLAAALAVVAVVLGGWCWNLVAPLSGPGRTVVVVVTRGESTSSVVATLAKDGVVSSGLLFRLDLAVTGTPVILDGAYAFHASSSFSDAKAVLADGPNLPEVTVRPGNTLREVAIALGGQVSGAYGAAFVAASVDGSVASPFQTRPGGSLEGLVEPGTYVVTPGLTARALLTQMVDGFTAKAATLGLTPSTVVEGHHAHDLVTIASIVEKEGYYAVNMPKVARVIFNRLAVHSVLQMDSTVLYALGQDGGTVTHAMLENPTPYNTYLHAGLTPTPICAVSAAAIAATLNPPPGPWRYFTLVDEAGHLAFATTFAEQLRNEAIGAANGV